MDTIFPVIVFLALLAVFGLDASQKRHQSLHKTNKEVNE